MDKDKQCIRCGKKGHTRRECKLPPVQCSHEGCRGDHLDQFCWKQHPELVPSGKDRQMSDQRNARYKRQGRTAYVATADGVDEAEGFLTIGGAESYCVDCTMPSDVPALDGSETSWPHKPRASVQAHSR